MYAEFGVVWLLCETLCWKVCYLDKVEILCFMVALQEPEKDSNQCGAAMKRKCHSLIEKE